MPKVGGEVVNFHEVREMYRDLGLEGIKKLGDISSTIIDEVKNREGKDLDDSDIQELKYLNRVLNTAHEEIKRSIDQAARRRMEREEMESEGQARAEANKPGRGRPKKEVAPTQEAPVAPATATEPAKASTAKTEPAKPTATKDKAAPAEKTKPKDKAAPVDDDGEQAEFETPQDDEDVPL